MRKLALTLAALLLLTGIASALDYEEKPDIAVSFYGSNYFQRGDEKNLVLTIYNDAKNEKIEYDPLNLEEAVFFLGREDMLFTAYNVNLELEGNEYMEVKTPTQKLPALPPMQPVTLNYIVKISDEAKAGEYELNLNVEFYRIDELKDLNQFTGITVPYQLTNETSSGQITGNGSIVYIYKQMNQYYELEYVKVTKTIPVKIYIEEKPVTLEVVEVKSENLIGMSKGKITLKVKNTGDKTAKNAYLILDTPSGIEAQGIDFTASSTSQTSTMSGVYGTFPTSSMPAMPGMTGSMASTPSLSSVKASYYVGDLKPNESAEATFYLKLNIKEGGSYPLHIKAVYLDEYSTLTESDSTTFGISVSDAPKITVKNVESRVYVNAKGELRVTFVSDSEFEDASVRISADSPLSVLSSEYYVGNVKAGEEYEAIFKLKASSEAEPVTYPAELTVVFKSLDEYVEIDPVRIGVKVNPKMEFEVQGQPSIAAGEEKVVTFVVKNVGEFEVKDATARITIVDPFSSTDDSAFIGDLKPGETANATFKLSVDSDATPKLYALNLEVKYKDPEGEWAYSEPAKAIINVIPAKPPYALYAIVGLIIVAAIIYYLRRR